MSAEETHSPISDKKRRHKSIVQDSDVSSSSKRGAIVNLGTGVEAADGVTISDSQVMGTDIKECQGEDNKVGDSNNRDESDQEMGNDIEESDVEEEDVKVCDICGDAGREELLAVCSRCSDGAEHTYCMREMLDKVPEGDWLCEECKCNEVLEARKLDHSKKLGSHDKSKFLGRTSSLLTDLSLKDGKELSLERPKPRNFSLNRQASSKRSGERMESCPTAKKQALESSMGSPTRSSPRQTVATVKDVSFKTLDKNKGKPSNQNCTGTEITGDSSEKACSPTTTHGLKGNLMKSNSFSSSNAKLNMKLSEDVHQKQGFDAKEGIGKLIGKSMSFKGLGRSSLMEPKVKMLPSKCAPVQDLKGPRNGKERTYERKNMMKLDHALPSQVTASSTKRSSGGSDSISALPVTNTRDYKSVQTDGKLSNMLKNAGHLSQKSSDSTANLGEPKKLSSTSIVVPTSVNGTSNALETKPNQFSVKDGSVISSLRTSDGSASADGARADGQGNQSEKAPEKTSGRSRQSLNNGTVSGSRRRMPTDNSASNKNKQGLHEENKLKAAIEAAMQKRQDLFKKPKIAEKPNEFPGSNTEVYPGGDEVSIQIRDSMSVEVTHEGDMDLHDSNLNSFKQLPVSVSKSIKLYPGDIEKSSVGDSISTVSAIPEQESVWQGGFEIHRNGKHPEMCGGFQAHMSVSASGKVLEMVEKFPKKIIVNEVPRPSVWPVHFKELGVGEDNIALYFFAKDSESYMRSYKILVDYMMKHDLALRGTIDGLEVLLFPSNHLPHKSKCWNTLYFIWGVFRGRRRKFLDDRVCSLMKCESSISDMVMLDKDVKLAENLCLHKPAAEQLSVSKGEANVIVGPSLHQCASLSNGDCYEECSVSGRCLDSPISIGDPKKSSKIHPTSLGEACPESGSGDLREQCQLSANRIQDHQKHMGETSRENNLPPEVTPDKQDDCLPSKSPLICKQKGESVVSSVHLHLPDDSNWIKKVNPEHSVKQESRCLVNMLKSGQMNLGNDVNKKEDTNYLLNNGVKLISEGGNLRSEGYVDINVSVNSNVDDLHGPPYSPKRHFHEDSVAVSSLDNDSFTCKKLPWVDRTDEKSMKEFGEFSGCNLNRRPHFTDGLEVQMGEDAFDEADDEKSTARNARSAEGCLFVVNSHLVQDIQPQDKSLSQKMVLSEVDRLPSESPNLELALGVKRKQAREGVLRLFAGPLDRKDLDMSPDILTSPKKDDEDASASLSLSLALTFPDKA